MVWVIYFIGVIALCTVAIALQRKNKSPIVASNFSAPLKIDRSDFEGVDKEYLVAVFTSNACQSCGNVKEKARVVESSEVAVCEIEFEDEKGKALHKKYEIEAVPTLVICDSSGVVQKSHIGPVSATDLWADLARVRGDDVQGCSSH